MGLEKGLVVNFLGGPGIGKSKLAEGLSAKLAGFGVQCEIVGEYAKELAWEDNRRALGDQLHVFAQQSYRQELLRGKVQVMLADSPLMLSVVYNEDKTSETFKALVWERFFSFRNLNYLLTRCFPYDSTGRIHDPEEAKEKDRRIEAALVERAVPFYRICPDDRCLEMMAEEVLKELRHEGGYNGNGYKSVTSHS